MNPNAARISQIDSQLRNIRSNIENSTDARRRVRERLQNLRNAITKLNQILDSYYNFPDQFSNLNSSVTNIDFKGSRRQNVDTRLDGIGSSIKMQRDRHHENLQLIQKRISTEANTEADHTSTISSLSAQITTLQAERRLLILQG